MALENKILKIRCIKKQNVCSIVKEECHKESYLLSPFDYLSAYVKLLQEHSSVNFQVYT